MDNKGAMRNWNLNIAAYRSFKLVLICGLIYLFPICKEGHATAIDSIKIEHLSFESEGVDLVGTLFQPMNAYAALIVVHSSDPVPRMTEFAQQLAKRGISVLTYDKRGVGESGGTYVGPQVGTNNISPENLNLLAKDASAAVHTMQEYTSHIPIGLIGFSQAGWIIPITAAQNPIIDFMVLFSCPTIITLEQLRFQFYTNGDKEFWEEHTEEEVRYHIKNDHDRYQFVDTDPKLTLETLSIPGLWLFGEKDIQIPVKLGIEHLNVLKSKGKAYEYCLFSNLGHNVAFSDSNEPLDIAIQWIKLHVIKL